MSDRLRTRSLLALALLLLTPGCATIINGPKQTVEISSDPPGAKVVVLPENIALVTPGEVGLSRKRVHTLLFELPCHRPETGYLDRTSSSVTALNAILGGLVGVWIDYNTGAVYRLIPDPLHVKLDRLEAGTPGAASCGS